MDTVPLVLCISLYTWNSNVMLASDGPVIMIAATSASLPAPIPSTIPAPSSIEFNIIKRVHQRQAGRARSRKADLVTSGHNPRIKSREHHERGSLICMWTKVKRVKQPRDKK